MKTLALFCFLAACQPCFAGGDTNIIAMSDWSKPVGTIYSESLRGRMIIAQERSRAYAGSWPETEFYLELQNVSGAAGTPMQIYFDPERGLHCEVLDKSGKPPPMIGGAGSGGGAGPCWIALLYDSTIRLRANMYGYGKKLGDGLLLQMVSTTQRWDIKPGDTNIYYLSATFTVAPPTNSAPRDPDVESRIWSGTLELPKMKIWDGRK